MTLLVARPRPSVPQGSRGQQRHPAVLLLHSTGKCKEWLAEHLERLARSGFVAAAFDARYHGERALPQAGLPGAEALSLIALGPGLSELILETEQSRLEVYHKALIRAWRTGAERPFVFDTTSDAMDVLDVLGDRPDVDRKRIGVVGVSLGGMAAWLLSAADERVAVAAPAIGVQSFSGALRLGLWGGRVDSLRPLFDTAAADLGRSEIDTAVVKAVWSRLVPGLAEDDKDDISAFDAALSLRCVAPRPLFILSGDEDPRCPVDLVRSAVADASEAYVAKGAAGLIRHFVQSSTGHEMTPCMWEEIDSFLMQTLSGRGDGLPPASKL